MYLPSAPAPRRRAVTDRPTRIDERGRTAIHVRAANDNGTVGDDNDDVDNDNVDNDNVDNDETPAS